MPQMVTNDAELLDAYVRAGSQEAFAQLVERHIGLVHATARRMLRDDHLADDATQAVFLLLSRQAGYLSKRIAIGGWLYLVTTYTVRNMQRAEGRRRRHERAVASTLTDRPPTAAASDVDLDTALSRLSGRLRDVLVLRYMQDLSVPEVAAGLGISEAAAGKRLVRAMSALREVLGVRQVGAAAALGGTAAAPAGLAGSIIQAVAQGSTPAGICQLAATTERGMSMLKLITTIKVAACVLVPLMLAAGVYAALPGSAGATTAPAATRPAVQAAQQTSADAPAGPGEIVALDEKMSLWWIDPAARYRIENGELIVHNPTAQAGAFAGFIGGPSWESHHVSLDFLVERDTSPTQPRPGAYDFNLQIAPHNMAMFFQLMGRACNICTNTPEVNGGQFTHVSDKQAPPVAIGRWYRLEVISDNGEITMMLDGKVMNQAQVPASTRGMLGLLVNFASDAIVHIRNMRVTLLEPTAQQLAESGRSAKDNWDSENERLKKAGEPIPKAPW